MFGVRGRMAPLRTPEAGRLRASVFGVRGRMAPLRTPEAGRLRASVFGVRGRRFCCRKPPGPKRRRGASCYDLTGIRRSCVGEVCITLFRSLLGSFLGFQGQWIMADRVESPQRRDRDRVKVKGF